MLTSRYISLNMTATQKLHKFLVLLSLLVPVCCRSGISSNNINPVVSYLLEYFCEKKCRTRWGALSACSWWRWHTQHRSLWRFDLVTSCLFLVSWIHLAVGTQLSSIMLKSLPSMTNATVPRSEKSVSAVFSLKSASALSGFWPIYTSKITAKENSFAHPIDAQRRRTLTCGVNFCMDWQVMASGWVASHQAIVFKQLPCVCRQPVRLWRQDNMSMAVLPKFLSNDKLSDINCFTLGCRLIQVLWLPEFALPIEGTQIVEEDAALLSWYEEKLDVFTHFLKDCEKIDDRLKSNHACVVNIIRCSTVNLVQVRAEIVQCLIVSNPQIRSSSWQWKKHITYLHREPFFIIFNRLSFWRQI